MSEPHRILVVDDSPTQLIQLQMVLEQDGFEVLTAADGKQALEVITEANPDVVVTDLQMPELNGLELVAASKASWPSLPVILTTSQGSEAIAAEALRTGASSYVPKSEMATSLASTVRQVLSVALSAKPHGELSKFAVRSSIELELPNDDTLVPEVIARLEIPIIELELLDEGERMQVAMAIDEALTNAIVHGNLEVSSELRQQDDGKPYFEMIDQRKKQSPYRDRIVYVSLHVTSTEAVFKITDQGKGFDPSILRDPTDPENLERAGGRGLLLINAFMDEVRHNEIGNAITLIKRKSNRPQASDG
jgi:CheY-like chemotaxis protein/anti-sigma regulatory factor (Ser/Thr protein kinase)